jgi:hypothetical protein
MALPLRKGLVDISALGVKELSRALAEMHPRLQRKVARQALKKSAKRVKPLLVQAVSGIPVKIETGNLLMGMAQAPIVPMKRSRTGLGFIIPAPTREQLGISPSDKWYYPWALEYGAPARSRGGPLPAFAWIRGTVNRAMPSEQRQMRIDIGKGIQREWKRGRHWVTTGKKA